LDFAGLAGLYQKSGSFHFVKRGSFHFALTPFWPLWHGKKRFIALFLRI
jgi:hypothetical protein